MGLLSVGTPLEWKDAEKYSDHVRKHGIEVLGFGNGADSSNF
jgi:glutamate--cysteine ligase catalytic subunit